MGFFDKLFGGKSKDENTAKFTNQSKTVLTPLPVSYTHLPCTKFINVYNYSGLNIGGKSYFNTPTHPHVAHLSLIHISVKEQYCGGISCNRTEICVKF